MQLEMTVITVHKHEGESAKVFYTSKLLGEVDHGGFLLETTTGEESFKIGETYTVTLEKK